MSPSIASITARMEALELHSLIPSTGEEGQVNLSAIREKTVRSLMSDDEFKSFIKNIVQEANDEKVYTRKPFKNNCRTNYNKEGYTYQANNYYNNEDQNHRYDFNPQNNSTNQRYNNGYNNQYNKNYRSQYNHAQGPSNTNGNNQGQSYANVNLGQSNGSNNQDSYHNNYSRQYSGNQGQGYQKDNNRNNDIRNYGPFPNYNDKDSYNNHRKSAFKSKN